MALTNIVRRAASHVAPLAARALGGQSCFHHHHYCSAVFAAGGGGLSRNIQFFRSSVPSALHHYSTKSDESLLRVIEAEIQFVEQNDVSDEAEAIPSRFPFKLEDNPGQQTVTLTQDYQGENIVVEVHMTNLITGKDDEDDDNDDDIESTIPLVVRISKNNRPCLEFNATAYLDQITFNSLSVKESDNSKDQIPFEGPDWRDLDKGFVEYLDMRGINNSVINILHAYMMNKKCKEYVRWLSNLKKFVEA